MAAKSTATADQTVSTKTTTKGTAAEVKVFPKPYPPLVDLKIANPVTYLKMWWHKVMWGEGVDIRFRIHPVTAIVMTAIIAGGAFGIGRITISPQTPIIKYLPLALPSPTPVPIHHAAYTGLLHYDTATKTHYLLTASAEAIRLSVPPAINLSTSVNKRILAIGEYNLMTQILTVTSTSDLELLPVKPSPLPTLKEIPEPTPIATM